MFGFRNLSIKNKLTAIIMLSCGLVIVLTSIISLTNEFITFRRGMFHSVSGLAAITGSNSTAALSFRDRQTAAELLQALKVEPHIVAAAIYNTDGKLFAGYQRRKDGHYDLPRRNDPRIVPVMDEERLAAAVPALATYFDFSRPITLNHKPIGTILIRVDQSWLHLRMKWFSGIIAVVMLGLFALTYLISIRLQRIISVPIQALAETMTGVKQRKDYSLRVAEHGNDELGMLIEGFNDMIAHIQQRERELNTNRRQLGEQVASRTRMLEESEKRKKQLLYQQEIQQAYSELIALLSSLDISEVIEKSLNRIARWTGAEWAGFYLSADNPGNISLEKSYSADPLSTGGKKAAERQTYRQEAGKELADQVLEEGHPLLVKRKVCPEEEGSPWINLAGYPLVFQQKRLGVLVLVNLRKEDRYTRSFLENSTRQLGITIHNALTFQDLRHKTAELKQSNLELIRASKMKSDFLANMSHELRTPLNAIIGFSEMLIDKHFGELNETQEDYLSDILSSGRHLLSLINDILDLSKVESGKMKLEPAEISVVEFCEKSLTMIKEKAMKHNITLLLDIGEIPKTIIADGRRLKQVLLNLLSNAAKFSPDAGAIRLSATVVDRNWLNEHIPPLFRGNLLFLPRDNQQSYLKFSVTDNGIGIHPDSSARIFNPFEQEESSTAKRYDGTGLGLALCKNLVALHHGYIWMESEVNKGSTFSIAIPLIQPADQEKVPATPADPGKSAHRNTSIALIVDDDEKTRRLFSAIIAKAGCRTITAGDSKTALDLAAEELPDLILLDLMLPEKDGWEVLTRLKQDQQTRDIPVIICSAIEDRDRARTLGACDYLLKPVREKYLLRCLEKIGLGAKPGQKQDGILVKTRETDGAAKSSAAKEYES